MSQENDSRAIEPEEKKVESTEKSQKEEKLVPQKAYEEVTSDMHKYKAQTRELKAALNEYEAKLRSIEEEKLMEQERWKELYEKQKQEREELEIQARSEKEAFRRNVKMSALKSELGPGLKDQYLVHADIDSIEFNEDGTVNTDSLLNAANRFRQEHSLLIPKNENNNFTSAAPKSTSSDGPVDLSKLSLKEKIELMKKIDSNQ